MSFRPLHDRVLVRRIDADEKTAGGLISEDLLILKESGNLGVVEATKAANKAA